MGCTEEDACVGVYFEPPSACSGHDNAESWMKVIESSSNDDEFVLSHSEGRKFSTAHTRNDDGEYLHRLFTERGVESAEDCHKLCLEHDGCLGVFYETSARRCHGLDDLGRPGGSSTGATAESWSRVPQP